MTHKELRDKLNTYIEIFEKLRPFIVLAINDYYVGDDKEELQSKLEDLGYDLP